MKKIKLNKFKENAMKTVFLIAACVSIIAVLLICIFLFANGLPTMAKIGVFKFLFGTEWAPENNKFGILPMIVGSIYVTIGAIIVGVPIGVLCAIFMARFCPKKLYKVLKPTIDLLAGIPSIVYGFVALSLIVPIMQNFGGTGQNVITASILLGIMILPTITSVTEASLRAVDNSYYEGALALGATHEESVFRAVLPAAKSGVLAGVILGVGRAIGETMAVSMIAGNQTVIPSSLLDGVRTLTTHIVIELGYSEGLHREALIATSVVLFVFVLIINACFSALKRRDK